MKKERENRDLIAGFLFVNGKTNLKAIFLLMAICI
jgi:hypothetical protein